MDFAGLYKNCRLCPRDCGVDRFAGAGYCGEGADLRLAFAGLHSGEEPPLCGRGGSGTVFVSGCNLGCVFCQNRQISGGSTAVLAGERLGRAVSPEEFTAICLKLQDAGAENINIVTGSHAVPALVRGLRVAKSAGLHLPVLWNSSGYEHTQTLELLDGCVDTWLPDMKTLDSALAARFFNAGDYPAAARRAIELMARKRPVIVRHLILPGYLESTRSVLRWFADTAAGAAERMRLSLMSQYTPVGREGPGRTLTEREYETVLGWLGEFGIDDGFCQELVTGSGWLPDFGRPNPFSSHLSKPVWHFRNF